MTVVDQTPAIRHKSKPPALQTLAACNWLTVAWGDDKKGSPQHPSIAPPRTEQGGIATMPTYVRGPSSKPQGRAHRARLRELLAPDLQLGARLPKTAYLGAVLGVDPTQALRHLRRMLAEEGI
jgi:hypothetical protein